MPKDEQPSSHDTRRPAGFSAIIRGDWLGGFSGVVIAGSLLFFLLRQKIKEAFA